MPSKLSDLVDNLSEIIIKVVKHLSREKISNQNVNLLGLKIIYWITYVKNSMEHILSQ